jgi:hypothetical protein
MRDAIVFCALVAAFAAAICFHLTLAMGLMHRVPRARALIALFIPPLAPYWGLREHMRFRSIGWIMSVAAYITARILQ